MFEELTNEELMEFDGGEWYLWAIGITAIVVLSATVITVGCITAGAATPVAAGSAAELSTEFLVYMGVTAAF